LSDEPIFPRDEESEVGGSASLGEINTGEGFL